MTSYPITPDGLEKLRAELSHLKKVERPKISKEIGVAREHGDLKENFEYHAAKDKQGMVEAKIRNIEDKVSRAEVIDPTKLSGDRVVFGATVVIMEIESEEEITYQIVSDSEADLEIKRISIGSPLARALIGKEVGDETRIPGKGGPRMVEIVDVTFSRDPP